MRQKIDKNNNKNMYEDDYIEPTQKDENKNSKNVYKNKNEKTHYKKE